MRILHISKYYHPFRGGIEKVIKELAEASVRQGHQVTVLCANESNHRVDEVIDGVRVIRLPNWLSLFSQPVTPSIFWEVQKLVEQSDAVQLHTPNPLFEFAYLFCPRHVPFIVTYHCEVIKQQSLVRFYEPVSRAVLERADRIVVATEKHLEYSRWLKHFAKKCQVIPFGIRPKYGAKTLAINNHINNIKDKIPRYFLFIGRMVSYKGINILIKAAKESDQEIVLIGKGPLLEMWQQLAVHLEIQNKVHFLGQVDDDDEFAAYIHGSDAVILPSLNEAEAFGLVLLEAMSCAKPMITTQLNSGVSFVNQDGVTGISVPPGDVKALAEAMILLHKEDGLRLKMGAAAYKRFVNHFTIDQFVAAYIDLYNYVVTTRKAA